jgi:hypothetical protein
MVLGRFCVVVPVLALAGSLATQRRVPVSAGTLPTTGPLWVGLLLGDRDCWRAVRSRHLNGSSGSGFGRTVVSANGR